MSTRTAGAATLLVGALLFGSGCGGSSEEEWNIVFAAARDGEWATFVTDPKGGAPIRIAEADAPIFEPFVPSPDGRRLVLPLGDSITVMRSDGSQLRRLADGYYATAAWSPDGAQIVFQGTRPGLSIVGVDGTGERRLTDDSSDGHGVWSPDGKRVAFARLGTGVMLIDLDGTDLDVLWRSPREAEQLHWSPDGRSLSFLHGPLAANDYGQGHELVTVSVAGRLLGRVPNVHTLGRIAWSPDGHRVAFTPYTGSGIVVMNADGSNRRSVVRGTEPVWSPDGRRIVYVGWEAAGGTQLRSIRPDGTGMRRLTSVYPKASSRTLRLGCAGRSHPPRRLTASSSRNIQTAPLSRRRFR